MRQQSVYSSESIKCDLYMSPCYLHTVIRRVCVYCFASVPMSICADDDDEQNNEKKFTKSFLKSRRYGEMKCYYYDDYGSVSFITRTNESYTHTIGAERSTVTTTYMYLVIYCVSVVKICKVVAGEY